MSFALPLSPPLSVPFIVDCGVVVVVVVVEVVVVVVARHIGISSYEGVYRLGKSKDSLGPGTSCLHKDSNKACVAVVGIDSSNMRAVGISSTPTPPPTTPPIPPTPPHIPPIPPISPIPPIPPSETACRGTWC